MWFKKIFCLFGHNWIQKHEFDGWVWATCKRCKKQTTWLASDDEMPNVINNRNTVSLTKWAYCPKCDIEFIGTICTCGYAVLGSNK